MNRRARLSRSVASGMVTLGVNVAYTLASVPLAMSYLGKREFGLWALAAQIAGYLLIMDACLSGSISRILVDEKDGAPGAYGSAVKTGILVTWIQGLIELVFGFACAPFVSDWLEIPPDLSWTFRIIFLCQCLCFASLSALKIFPHLLTTHQRVDLTNHGQTLSLIVAFVVQWIAFRSGQGVYSLVWSGVAATFTVILWSILVVLRCRLLPKSGQWGQLSKTKFRELFLFSGDLFLQVVGWQLLGATQLVLIKLHLGLEVAGIYAICIKPFSLGQQAVWRIFDTALPAMSEMAARGEKERLGRRFGDMIVLSGALGVAAAMALAVCNTSFVHLWTKGAVGWPSLNDWLLAGVFIAQTLNRVHGGLAYVTKDVKQMRYVYFVEGLVYFGLASLLAPAFGLTAILALSILTSFSISGAVGLARSAHRLGLSSREAAGRWLWPPLRFGLVLIPMALAVHFALRPLAPLPHFLAGAIIIGTVGSVGAWFVGIPFTLRIELRHLWGRLLARFRKNQVDVAV